MAFPLRQLLVASPALALFAYYGVITPMQLLGLVALLVTSFAAAGALGMAASTLRPTSHEAQGAALGAAAALLLLPLSCVGWMLLGAGLLVLVARTNLPSGSRAIAALSLLAVALVGGATASPVGAVMAMSGSSIGQSSMIWDLAGPTGTLLWSALTMAGAAVLFGKIAVHSLESGGSVKA
jgi:hypothetical protein